jgi:hypothetical protein
MGQAAFAAPNSTFNATNKFALSSPGATPFNAQPGNVFSQSGGVFGATTSAFGAQRSSPGIGAGFSAGIGAGGAASGLGNGSNLFGTAVGTPSLGPMTGMGGFSQMQAKAGSAAVPFSPLSVSFSGVLFNMVYAAYLTLSILFALFHRSKMAIKAGHHRN